MGKKSGLQTGDFRQSVSTDSSQAVLRTWHGKCTEDNKQECVFVNGESELCTKELPTWVESGK